MTLNIFTLLWLIQHSDDERQWQYSQSYYSLNTVAVNDNDGIPCCITDSTQWQWMTMTVFPVTLLITAAVNDLKPRSTRCVRRLFTDDSASDTRWNKCHSDVVVCALECEVSAMFQTTTAHQQTADSLQWLVMSSKTVSQTHNFNNCSCSDNVM